MKKIIKKNGYLFLVTPNHDDFYMYSLPKNNLKKYKSFIYHAAHPFYYSKNSLNFILKKSGYFNNTISTDQDYSILNFMNWFSHGKPSENISTAKKIPKNIKKLDILFKKYINESDLGSNLWSISIN